MITSHHRQITESLCCAPETNIMLCPLYLNFKKCVCSIKLEQLSWSENPKFAPPFQGSLAAQHHELMMSRPHALLISERPVPGMQDSKGCLPKVSFNIRLGTSLEEEPTACDEVPLTQPQSPRPPPSHSPPAVHPGVLHTKAVFFLPSTFLWDSTLFFWVCSADPSHC